MRGYISYATRFGVHRPPSAFGQRIYVAADITIIININQPNGGVFADVHGINISTGLLDIL